MYLQWFFISTTKKIVFYVTDFTTVLKDRLSKLGGGIIVIKRKTTTTFSETSMAHTCFLFRVSLHSRLLRFPLSSFQKHTCPRQQPRSPAPSVPICRAARSVQPFVFWLSSEEVLKTPFATEATSVTTLYLPSSLRCEVYCEIPFCFLFPFTLLSNKNTYFFNFVTYPANVLGHFLEVGKAWLEAQQSHFSSGTFSFFL